jgi:hypothetical protein
VCVDLRWIWWRLPDCLVITWHSCDTFLLTDYFNFFFLSRFGPFVYSHTSLSQSVNSYIFPFPPLAIQSSIVSTFIFFFQLSSHPSPLVIDWEGGRSFFYQTKKKLVSFSSFFSFSSQIKTLQNWDVKKNQLNVYFIWKNYRFLLLQPGLYCAVKTERERLEGGIE